MRIRKLNQKNLNEKVIGLFISVGLFSSSGLFAGPPEEFFEREFSIQQFFAPEMLDLQMLLGKSESSDGIQELNQVGSRTNPEISVSDIQIDYNKILGKLRLIGKSDDEIREIFSESGLSLDSAECFIEHCKAVAELTDAERSALIALVSSDLFKELKGVDHVDLRLDVSRDVLVGKLQLAGKSSIQVFHELKAAGVSDEATQCFILHCNQVIALSRSELRAINSAIRKKIEADANLEIIGENSRKTDDNAEDRISAVLYELKKGFGLQSIFNDVLHKTEESEFLDPYYFKSDKTFLLRSFKSRSSFPDGVTISDLQRYQAQYLVEFLKYKLRPVSDSLKAVVPDAFGYNKSTYEKHFRSEGFEAEQERENLLNIEQERLDKY